jgi:ureidoglycolate dehydrogenase (NAD+)
MMFVPADRLSARMHSALAERGLSAEHGAYVVDGLIGASLRGIDTHGVRLFPTYLAELDGGRAKAKPDLAWSPCGRGARRLDAGGALGLVAGMVAAREAIRLAREQGTAAVSVGNSNHFAAASTFTLEIAKAGMIGVCSSNSDALMAAFDGSAALFGTNPLSVCAPANDEVFCLDMATSQVAFSQVKARLARREPLPEGWALAPDGTDAAGVRSWDQVAALKPLGGYKGQGLAMAISILCGLLAGMPLDHELTHFYTEPFDAGRRVSHLFIALDISAFLPLATFRERLTRYLDYVRQSPAHGEMVRVAGDLEAAAARVRREQGIPLTDDDVTRLREAGIGLE